METGQTCPVGKLETLLVATDRSPFSEGAISAAIAFARHCSSRTFVMTVVEKNPEYETAGAEQLQNEKREAVHYLGALKRRMLEEVPAERIAEAAKEKGVDLIVVGAYGRTGIRRLLMGSTTEKVVGLASCAVLVAKTGQG